MPRINNGVKAEWPQKIGYHVRSLCNVSFVFYQKEKNDRNWWLAQSIGGVVSLNLVKSTRKHLIWFAQRFCEFIALECFPFRAAAATWKWFAGCEVFEFIEGEFSIQSFTLAGGSGGMFSSVSHFTTDYPRGSRLGELLGASTPYQGGHYWPPWIAGSHTWILELMKHSTIYRQICYKAEWYQQSLRLKWSSLTKNPMSQILLSLLLFFLPF